MTKHTEDAIERHVRDLFAREGTHALLAELSLLDDPCFRGLDRDEMLERVTGAHAARARFERERPAWASQVELPLVKEACVALQRAGDHRMNIVGCYGASLRFMQWYRGHPGFRAFSRGLLACKHTPIALRTDESLLAEFSPRRLWTADGLAVLLLGESTIASLNW